MNGLDESERRERERAEEASSGESWTHLLCSTRLGKKTPELTCVLRYTHTHTFVWRYLATQISARVHMHPQWINTVKDIALAHTHMRSKSQTALQGTCSVTSTSLHQQMESFAPSGLFEVISGSVIKRRCGHVRFPPYTALWHPEATCGVAGGRNLVRERVCWRQTQDLSTGGVVQLCVCQWDGKKTPSTRSEKSWRKYFVHTACRKASFFSEKNSLFFRLNVI